MHYRAATLSDLDAITSAITQLAEEQLAAGSRIDPAGSESSFRSRIAEQIVDGGVIVAADSAGELVGIVTFYRVSDGLTRRDSVGVVEYLYVDEDRRREGIGEALLTRAESKLAADGIDVVELEVLAENEDAQTFYADCGYRSQRLRLAKRLDDS